MTTCESIIQRIKSLEMDECSQFRLCSAINAIYIIGLFDEFSKYKRPNMGLYRLDDSKLMKQIKYKVYELNCGKFSYERNTSYDWTMYYVHTIAKDGIDVFEKEWKSIFSDI
jgi:hypothetical protein